MTSSKLYTSSTKFPILTRPSMKTVAKKTTAWILPTTHPSSLEAAISKYPNRAVRVLFARLGLVYSKFEEQTEERENRK